MTMLRNYLKISFRSFKKQKVFVFINLFGLTTGLLCFLLIGLYLFDELTFDRFHKNTDNIYRVLENRSNADGKESKIAAVAANISNTAIKNLPEVSDATRFSMLGRVNISNDENENVFYESYYLADASFFQVFDFPVVAGNVSTALTDPHSAVLTKETAKKIFGTTDVVGKLIYSQGDSLPYKITSVITIPGNSHLQFNILFSESTLYASNQFMEFFNNDWASNSFVTYLLIPGKNEEQVASKITAMVTQRRTGEDGITSSFTLQPLKDIHFKSDGVEGDMGTKGNLVHMYVFGIVALFVLFIACINYINLTTAKLSSRSKEIAVRKVSGASRESLVKQFFTEAAILTVVALVLSVMTAQFLLPWFNSFTEKNLSLGLDTDYRIWMGVVLITILVSLIAGIYPALYQSGLKPNLLLKARIISGKGNLSIRKGLVVFQFALSIIMVVATIVVYGQLKYVDNADMGFDKEQLIVVDINSGEVRRSAETIKAEFRKIPSVKSVSASSRVPGEWKVLPKVGLNFPGKSLANQDVYFMATDDQFLETFKISLSNGRNFSSSSSADSTSVLINETAANLLGIKEASGQLIQIPSVTFSGNASDLSAPFNARIIGIVKDFNFRSLREKVQPIVLGYQNNPIHNIDYFTAKIETANVEKTIASMKSVLSGIDQAHLFEYNFLDKQWENFYREDHKRQIIFLAIALLTILIACFGLFGLATYEAEQRVKEIGIRKVLGASVMSLVAMLSKDFAKLVLIASIIAIPIAWWTMNNWLSDFEYRIHISWWFFAIAALGALVIAILTVGLQTTKAALSNPVKNLRTE